MTSSRKRAGPRTTSFVLAPAPIDEVDVVAVVGVSGLCSMWPWSGVVVVVVVVVVVMVGRDDVGIVAGKP